MDRLIETARENVVRFGQYDVAKTPLLKDSFSLAKKHAEYVLGTFATYHTVIKDLFNLTQEELRIIQQVNEHLHKPRGAHEFIQHMRPYKNDILDIVRHSGDMYLPANRKGVDQLAIMMENAWKKRKSDPNWQPTDKDPFSDRVIWGFVNGAIDPKTDIDFTICHGIERIATAQLRSEGVTDYIDHKDWLLSAMTDVVALRGLQGKYPEKTVLPLWERRRPDGLGWVSQDQLKAYKEFQK